MRLSGLGVAAALFVSGSAIAADLPSRVSAPPLFVAAPWSWAGFYAGVNAGYSFDNRGNISTVGQAAANIATVADGARPGNVSLEKDGFIGGGQIGFNWQTGAFVYGVEADIQYTDLRASTNVVTTGVAFPGVRNNLYSQRLDYLGTVRGRLGYAMDRTLLFVTGGLAYGDVRNSVNLFGPLPGNVLQFTGSNSGIRAGYTVGAGIEQAFGTNWTAKLEYLYYDLGDRTVAANLVAGSGGVGTGYNVRFRNDGHIIRAGLNYKW